MLYYNYNLSQRKGQPFLKGGKGVYKMSIGDALLSLVDKLLAEREKVIRLELLQQIQQEQDEQSN